MPPGLDTPRHAVFLALVARAHTMASIEQRQLIWLLAAQHRPLEENIQGIKRIMNWCDD